MHISIKKERFLPIISSVKFTKISPNRKETYSNQKKGKDLGFKSTIASVKEFQKDQSNLHLYQCSMEYAPMELHLKKLDLDRFQV